MCRECPGLSLNSAFKAEENTHLRRRRWGKVTKQHYLSTGDAEETVPKISEKII